MVSSDLAAAPEAGPPAPTSDRVRSRVQRCGRAGGGCRQRDRRLIGIDQATLAFTLASSEGAHALGVRRPLAGPTALRCLVHDMMFRRVTSRITSPVARLPPFAATRARRLQSGCPNRRSGPSGLARGGRRRRTQRSGRAGSAAGQSDRMLNAVQLGRVAAHKTAQPPAAGPLNVAVEARRTVGADVQSSDRHRRTCGNGMPVPASETSVATPASRRCGARANQRCLGAETEAAVRRG
jgi:hypothetical protein